MNYLNVRLYSTKIDRPNLSQNKVNNIEKTFKVDSNLFLYLSNYLKESPINEITQRNIEKFLLNYSYVSLETKSLSSKSLINFDYFRSTDLKKRFFEASDNLNLYINNLKKKSYNIKSTSSIKLVSHYNFQRIVNVLDNSVIIEIALGNAYKIISNNHKMKDEFLELNIILDISNAIISNYLYALYKQKIIAEVLLFQDKYLDFIKSDQVLINPDTIELITNKFKYIIIF